MSTITTLDVTGMTCGHCVTAVTKELEAVDGVGRVSVTLAAGETSQVTVFSAEPLPEDALRAAIDEAGYDVAAVSSHGAADEYEKLADTRVETYGTGDGGQGPQPVALTTRAEAAEAAGEAAAGEAAEAADGAPSSGGCGCGGCGCGA